MPELPTIIPTPPERQAAALELLFSSLSPAERAAQMALSLAAVRGHRVAIDGLLVALRDGQMVGVVWASELGGHSALVWPPQIVLDEPDVTARDLLHAADDWMRSRSITLATAYLTEIDSKEARRFTAGGYEPAAEIVYLLSEAREFPETPPASRLTLVPCSEADWARLTAIVEATYIDTRDCPRLNGVRSTHDVLAGYRQSGGFSPARWLIVQNEREDVGCLILADHARDDHYELVYMGVIPAARGRGVGTDITRYAQWLTRCAGRASLVLAVDAENSPALRGYAACGFREWDRRRVFLKTVDERDAAAGEAS